MTEGAWRSSLLEVIAAVMYRDDLSVILIINFMFNIKLPPPSHIRVLVLIYKLRHPSTTWNEIPYYYKRSILAECWHLLRKAICQNIAPNCVLNPVRIALYRLCGFKIGKGTFIGMKCYLDDLCVDKIRIGNNVTISYGVYFACHGRKQGHNNIVIKDGSYIGMRASITARHDIEIGENAVIGAMGLVNKSIPADVTAVGVPCKVVNSSD